jgi:hypothetical protein
LSIPTPTTSLWKVATLFIDSASNYIFVHLQHSTSAKDTLLAKKAYEQVCTKHG